MTRLMRSTLAKFSSYSSYRVTITISAETCINVCGDDLDERDDVRRVERYSQLTTLAESFGSLLRDHVPHRQMLP